MALANSNLLIFTIGPVPCCVDSNNVQIVIEPPAHITAIPGSNSYRPGLFTHVKRAVAVYDVRTKFNLSTEQRGKILITEINQRMFGFWVDNIQEVISPSQGNWQQLPAECPRELFEGVLMYKNQLVFKTSFEALANAQVNTQTDTFINQLINASKKTATNTSDELTASSHTLPHQDTTTKNLDDKALPIISDIRPVSKAFIAAEPRQTEAAAPKNLGIKSHVSINTAKPESVNLTKPQHDNTTLKRNAHVKPSTVTKSANAAPLKTQQSSPATWKKPVATVNPPLNPGSMPTHQAINQQHDNDSTIKNRIEHQNRQDLLPKDNTEASPGSFGIIVFILVLLSTGLLGYYFFYPSLKVDNNQKSAYQRDIIAPVNEPEIKPVAPVVMPPLTDIKPVSPLSIETMVIDNTDNEVTPVQAAGQKAPVNNATISRTEDTIIITIDDPEAKLNIVTQEKEPPAVVAESDIKNSTVGRSLITDPLIEAPVTEQGTPLNKLVKTSRQVTHTVVKGDTLWHIAKRYIQDPYKYKQLARLSKIKNPDRIYPGNRIIIIIKN